MTPIEGDYTSGTSSTNCIATMKIRGESCRAVDSSNAPGWSRPPFADCCKRFSPHWPCRGVTGMVATPGLQTEELHAYTCVGPDHRFSRISEEVHIFVSIKESHTHHGYTILTT